MMRKAGTGLHGPTSDLSVSNAPNYIVDDYQITKLGVFTRIKVPDGERPAGGNQNCYREERERSMSTATSTTDHDIVRSWVEERGGRPAVVTKTRGADDQGGILRIDFDDPGERVGEGLEEIEWSDFFDIFEENDLAFLHGDGASRFNKFVSRKSDD